MVDANSPVKSSPRCSRATFTKVLTDAGSPWAAAAPALYDLIAGRKHDPAFWLAVGGRETTYGTNHDSVLYRCDTHSLTNARTVRYPSLKQTAWKDAQGNVLPVPVGMYQIITDPVRKSQYVRYAAVSDSLIDGMYRLDDPTFAYQKAGATSIGAVLAIWTEDESDAYTQYVVDRINEWQAMGVPPVPTTRPPHIALSAGHRNTSGGDPHETQQTAVLTPAIAAACRALGMDVRVVQGNDGRDMFPGDLHAVAQTVASWDAGGWPVDIYLETHTEGAGGARGMFAIYPDAAGDVDAGVRDRLGPDIVARITAATGLGKRGNGLLSEKQTGVGIDGFRLGIFAYTVSLKGHAARLIVEFGAHDEPHDLAIVDADDFHDKAAAQVAGAFATYLGWSNTVAQTDEPLILPGNTHGDIPVVLGFKNYLLGLAQERYPQDINAAILSIVGYPQAPEYKGADGNSYQIFERTILQFNPNNAPPFDIVMLRREDDAPEEAA